MDEDVVVKSHFFFIVRILDKFIKRAPQEFLRSIALQDR